MKVLIPYSSVYGYEKDVITKSDQDISNYDIKLFKKVTADYVPYKWKIVNNNMITCPMVECWDIDGNDFTVYEDEIGSLLTVKPVKYLQRDIIDKIIKKTDRIISRGIDFDSKTFDIYNDNITYYLSIIMFYVKSKIDATVIYPTDGVAITINNNGVYMLRKAKCDEFFNTVIVGLQNIIKADLEQRQIVKAMTTVEQLNAYVDPR